VESYEPLRTALAELLAGAIPDAVIRQTGSIDAALLLLKRQRPTLAIVEAQSGGQEAFAYVRRLRAVQPELAILALGHAHELPYVRRAAAAGALEYLRKSDPPEKLVRAARLVLDTFEPARSSN
jgi:DNA-binding NarL/FixJ family response regulator